MSDTDRVAGYIDYFALLMQAIIDNRVTAQELKDMTLEQREEYKEKLVAEEKAEIERGKAMHRTEPAPPVEE